MLRCAAGKSEETDVSKASSDFILQGLIGTKIYQSCSPVSLSKQEVIKNYVLYRFSLTMIVSILPISSSIMLLYGVGLSETFGQLLRE